MALVYFSDDPNILLERGQFQKRNILLGVANDDGSSFSDAIPGMTSLHMNARAFQTLEIS